jgi:hypothetical protein
MTTISVSAASDASTRRWRGDTDGAFTLSDGLLAGLPPPPRDLSLEISRDELSFASAGQGRGVILHSGYALTLTGHEDP